MATKPQIRRDRNRPWRLSMRRDSLRTVRKWEQRGHCSYQAISRCEKPSVLHPTPYNRLI